MAGKIRVTYWRGTTRLVGYATTDRGALRIGSRNKNAFGPTYYGPDGQRLYPLTDPAGRTWLCAPDAEERS